MKKGVLFLLMLVAASCSRPKVIPDNELALIFREVLLTNAYLNNHRVPIDSARIYEPIFDRYGYTVEDLNYTIDNFSKRKSARLRDVMEQSIALLESEGVYYDREVAILDTIDRVSRRAFRREIYADTLIRVDKLKDTSKLRMVFPHIHPGDYIISFRYMVDSLDKNTTLRGGIWFDGPGTSRRDFRSIFLRRNTWENFTRTLIADSLSRRLVINLWGVDMRPRRPSITVRDLKIEYVPPVSVAVDSLYLRKIDVRIFAEEFFRYAEPKDSL